MKAKIGIIYGGQSDEHNISIRSAQSILKHLDLMLFEPICIGITKQGAWCYTGRQIQSQIEQTVENSLLFEIKADKTVLTIKNNNQIKLNIDLVFPVLHGSYGEDGRIQGLLHMLHLPFVGVDVMSASIAMNKYLTKKIAAMEGIPIVPYTYYHKSDDLKQLIAENASKTVFPSIVKPVNLGSSIGITKINNAQELLTALEYAMSFDNEVLVEKFIQGEELEIAILEVNGVPTVTPPGKIILSDKYDFYNYESKYEDEQAIIVELPAKVDASIEKTMKKYAIKMFKAIQARHFIRIDMFLDSNGKIYINEVNAIPGFTTSSMFPDLCSHLNYDFKSLITHIIKEATVK